MSVDGGDAGVPALTRGLALLRQLAAQPEGTSATELAEATGAPRATLYRLLRTLVAEGFAAPAGGAPGRYVLGPALGHMAGAASPGRSLLDAARPVMDSLANALSESVKLVVRDGLTALTVAVSIPRRESYIAARVGHRLPLHVGASQRLLLAHAPADIRERVLQGPLPRAASRTVTSRRRLARDLALLAGRRELASHGEGIEGIGATAALVGPPVLEPVAVLVTVYVYASQSPRRLAEIRRATGKAADAITRALGNAQ